MVITDVRTAGTTKYAWLIPSDGVAGVADVGKENHASDAA
jgi:hypothetical protein